MVVEIELRSWHAAMVGAGDWRGMPGRPMANRASSAANRVLFSGWRSRLCR
jgi:hypothetical protein